MSTFEAVITRGRRLSRLLLLALGGLALSLTLIVGSSPAHAASVHTQRAGQLSRAADSGYTQTFTFESKATGYALDSGPLGSNGLGAVYGDEPNGGGYQQWTGTLLYTDNNGDYVWTFQDVATRGCLDSNTSQRVYTDACNGGSFQDWIAVPQDDGTVVLQDLATSYVLDGNGGTNGLGQIYTNSLNGGSYQHWVVL